MFAYSLINGKLSRSVVSTQISPPAGVAGADVPNFETACGTHRPADCLYKSNSMLPSYHNVPSAFVPGAPVEDADNSFELGPVVMAWLAG